MRILVIGSGGREHALVWKISQSPLADEIYCAPGNPGIAEHAECMAIDPTSAIELADFAQELRVGLTVVGPELPLTMGIVDEFLKRGLRIFGPRKLAAELEGSKVYAKEFMQKYDIPTASSEVAHSPDEARQILDRTGLPAVVKVDGLAAGKGVFICLTPDDADKAVEAIMVEKKFGGAGERAVIEQFLEGTEASFIVVSDGRRALPLVTSQDHKTLLEEDKGPNTGGMGAFSPAVNFSQDTFRSVMQDVVQPTLAGLEKEGRRYAGFLYVGLMLTPDGPRVLEYNCRLGDPEAQVILPRLQSDLVVLLHSVASKELGRAKIEWDTRAATCVVLAAEGYPEAPKKGMPIEGLEEVKDMEDVFVFHAGTKQKDDQTVVGGGRVLGVTGMGEKLSQSIRRAYEAVSQVHFEGMHFRRDIGLAALKGRTSQGKEGKE
jgi:phosphoribosylamine--glycine ligase